RVAGLPRRGVGGRARGGLVRAVGVAPRARGGLGGARVAGLPEGAAVTVRWAGKAAGRPVIAHQDLAATRTRTVCGIGRAAVEPVAGRQARAGPRAAGYRGAGQQVPVVALTRGLPETSAVRRAGAGRLPGHGVTGMSAGKAVGVLAGARPLPAVAAMA